LHGDRGGYNVITCDVKSLNVVYRYSNGTYSLVSSSASDLPQAQRISDATWAVPLYVPPAIEGAGIYSGSYTDTFAAKLSQVALAMTSYVMEPTEALDTEYIQPNIGSRLPLAPFLLIFTIALVYW
jgi:hypothetical protein